MESHHALSPDDGDKIAVNDSASLYEYWTNKISPITSPNQEMKTNKPLVNLTRREYFKMINRKNLKAKIIHCKFKDYKNDRLQITMVYSEKSRGNLAKFIAKNLIE
ncbi:MAG: peroxide stress protein YaaA [Flavobacteriales bacterium AspAUS03]